MARDELGVPGAAWQREPAGVWVHGRKLASCGLHLRRGVAIHGFAFNLCTPPAMWQAIVPCGLSAGALSSVAQERERLGLPDAVPTVAEVASRASVLLREHLLGEQYQTAA